MDVLSQLRRPVIDEVEERSDLASRTRPVVGNWTTYKETESEASDSDTSSISADNPLAGSWTTHHTSKAVDTDLPIYDLEESQVPNTDSDNDSGPDNAYDAPFVPYPSKAVMEAPVLIPKRRAVSVNAAIQSQSRLGKDLVRKEENREKSMEERLVELDRLGEDDRGLKYVDEGRRKGVYIPPEFRALGEGPQMKDRVGFIDDNVEEEVGKENEQELRAVPELGDRFASIDETSEESDRSANIDQSSEEEEESEQEDEPERIEPEQKFSDPGIHRRQATPPPVPTTSLRPPLRPMGMANGGRLSRWKPMTLSTPTEVAEEEDEADITDNGVSSYSLNEDKPTEKLPEVEKSSGGWRQKVSLFRKSSSGGFLGNSLSLASITEEAEDQQKKPPKPTHIGSEATLGSSSNSLGGSQTSLALPKPAEGEEAPTPIKHKWFRFPKLLKEDKRPQRPISPLANSSSITVNAVAHIEPDVRAARKSHSAGRSRTKDTPLFKRLMMRKGKAASSGVAPTSDAGRKKQQQRAESEDDLSLESQNEESRFKHTYKQLRKLGAGGHSTVRLAQRISDNTYVVCKHIRESSVWHWHTDPGTKERLPLEVHIMRKFNAEGSHPGIIRYIEHYSMDPRFVIVMEYLGEEWVDLYDYIEMFGPVDEEVAVDIFGQIVETVQYMHWMGYVHNDIKDENIMINTRTRQIKLIDFGSATSIVPGKTCDLFYGTKKFASPEAVQGLSYYPEAQEVWALGTLLYVLLFKMDPFKNDDEILDVDIEYRIDHTMARSRRDGGEGIEVSDAAVEVLKGMMDKEWATRLRMGEVLKMEFFEDYQSRTAERWIE